MKFEIEDYNGNTIMSFKLNKRNEVYAFRDCNLADEEEDENKQRVLRIQSDVKE